MYAFRTKMLASNSSYCVEYIYRPVIIIQVVGNRGSIEINPRLMMMKESSIVGVMLSKTTQVRKL